MEVLRGKYSNQNILEGLYQTFEETGFTEIFEPSRDSEGKNPAIRRFVGGNLKKFEKLIVQNEFRWTLTIRGSRIYGLKKVTVIITPEGKVHVFLN